MVKETFYNLPKEKQDKIIQSAIDEFAQYGFDMSSVQRIVESSGISRGSFYQYFKDKSGIYLLIINKITNDKMKFLSQFTSMREHMGIFDFFYELFKKGFEWGIENSKYSKIGIDLCTSKTIDKDAFLKHLTKKAYELINSTHESFLLKPIQNSMDKGEISSQYSIEDVNIYVNAMWKGMKNIMITKNVSDILGKEGDSILTQFISMLRYGLSNKELKK